MQPTSRRTVAGRVTAVLMKSRTSPVTARVSNEGVDLAEVGRHAFVARRRQAVHDGALVLDVVAMLVFLALRQVWGFLVLFVGLWAINVAYEYVARYSRLSRSLAWTPMRRHGPRSRRAHNYRGPASKSTAPARTATSPCIAVFPVRRAWPGDQRLVTGRRYRQAEGGGGRGRPGHRR